MVVTTAMKKVGPSSSHPRKPYLLYVPVVEMNWPMGIVPNVTFLPISWHIAMKEDQHPGPA
jgi:hypothetical protein